MSDEEHDTTAIDLTPMRRAAERSQEAAIDEHEAIAETLPAGRTVVRYYHGDSVRSGLVIAHSWERIKLRSSTGAEPWISACRVTDAERVKP